jgi:hypothetical protein
MTIGAGTFEPSGGFSFPRSYIYGLSLRLTGATSIVYVGNVLSCGLSAFPTTTLVWKFLPEFIPWNSNRYTLDHLMIEAYFFNTGVPGVFPLPYKLGTWFPPGAKKRYLYVIEPEFDGTGHHEFDLPGQPDDYWTPPPQA